MAINPVAAGGFAAAAATYARIRPAYARPAVGRIADLARSMAPGGRVLDVAAGTGILTGQLARLGLQVIAVEPLEEMVLHLRRAVPAAPTVRGLAEALPVVDHSVGLCTVAQSFHWFDEPAALAELWRVLEPGAALALIWNARDESEPWVAALTDLVEQRTGGRPYDDHRERPWAAVVAAAGGFSPLESASYPNPVPTGVEGVLDRLRSTSFVAALPDESRDDLVADARVLLVDGFGLSGTFAYPHDTVLHICRTVV